MKDVMRWKDQLGEKELAHMKALCSGILAGLKRTRKAQREERERRETIGLHPEVCFECRKIACKLAIES